MTKVTSINSSVDALREQLRAQAEAALHDSKSESPFADKIATAIKEVAKSQEASAKITKAYELGVENDLSKVMISQQISSLGFQMTLNVRNKMLSAYKDIMNMPV